VDLGGFAADQDLMATAFELGPGLGGERVGLGFQAVGEPLVMEARAVERGLERVAVDQQVEQHLNHLGGDPRAAAAAEGVGLAPLPGDHRRHRGEHPLSRRHGVGLPLHQPEEVGLARRGGEVVHLVVEEEPGARHPEAAAEELVEGGGEGDQVAVAVDDREVGGVGAAGGGRVRARPGFHVGRRGGVVEVDLRRPPRDPGGRQELLGGRLGGRRIAEQEAVGEGAPEDLGQQMVAVGAEARQLGPAQLFEHADGLAEDDAAGRREGHRRDLPAEGVEEERLAPLGTVGRQVGGGEHPAVRARNRLDRRRDRAGGDPFRPLRGIAVERRREVGEAQQAADRRRGAAGVPDARRLREAEQELAGLLPVQQVVEMAADRETVGRELPGRRHHPRPGEAPIALLQGVKAGRRAGNSGGQRPHQRGAGDRLALSVQIHVAPGPGRPDLAEVEGREVAPHPHHGEAAAAEVAGLGIDHRQRQRGGHRRVHGVPAVAQGRQPGLDRQGIGRRHRPARARGRRRGRGPAGRRQEQREEERREQELLHASFSMRAFHANTLAQDSRSQGRGLGREAWLALPSRSTSPRAASTRSRSSVSPLSR
jgi:hypothetical protein